MWINWTVDSRHSSIQVYYGNWYTIEIILKFFISFKNLYCMGEHYFGQLLEVGFVMLLWLCFNVEYKSRISSSTLSVYLQIFGISKVAPAT